jgi:caa(3)-type oxidase subunit IV
MRRDRFGGPASGQTARLRNGPDLVVAVAIATIKGTLIAAVFIELRESQRLTLTFAGAGFFWLGIMLWLTLADYMTRPNFPPSTMWGD